MTVKERPQWLEEIKWTSDGLVAAIAQDFQTGEILMMAWMNAESLNLSIQEKRAIYWSRSRQCLWRKGETSGNVQTLHEIRLDCDSDALLLKVEQLGDIACHTGRRSCFYKRLEGVAENLQWVDVDPVLKDPKEMYSK